MTAAFGWSLAASISLATPATAQTGRIDLPTAPLAQSLSRLSARTGASIGYSGRLPAFTTRAVRGARGAADALHQMLDGSGYRAVATGPASFRIEAISPAPRPAPSDPQPRPALQPEIVVTALKRAAPLLSVPATVRVVRESELNTAGTIAGSGALAAELPTMTMSSLGPGRNRMFLRGIGDGPLNGFNQGSVAILLDEARLNYDAPDPDWALVDIDQVEILEGPQGPLYGTGALGGIVKITTRAPDLNTAGGRLDSGIAVTQDGDLSNSQSAVLNLPLAANRLALRAVAYRQRQAGWIDTQGAARDSNVERLVGGRIAVRWAPASGWTIDLTGALQGRRARDSQYVDGDLGRYGRPFRKPEPRDLDARLATLTVKGRIGDLELTSLTAISGQEAAATYDATPLAITLGTNGQTMVEDGRDYRLFDQEFRLGSSGARPINWLIGASLIRASTRANITAADKDQLSTLLSLKRHVSEAALFGQASTAVTPTLHLEGGARLFVSKVDDGGEENGMARLVRKRSLRGAGSVSLSWSPNRDQTYYLRAATAYRPGGANIEPEAHQQRYDADELASVELGARIRRGSSLAINATAFASQWQHVQADELLANGLVATRNAGNARNIGIEADLRWSPLHATDVHAGLMVQSARLERGSSAGADAPRLPAVPQFSLRTRASHRIQIGGWTATVEGGLQFVGATHLSFDPIVDRRTGGRVVVDAAYRMENGNWTVALSGANLANGAADTFAFGNPYRARAVPQRTPMRPRTIGLSIGRRF